MKFGVFYLNTKSQNCCKAKASIHLYLSQFGIFQSDLANQFQTPSVFEKMCAIVFVRQIFLGNSVKLWLEWSKVIYRVERLGSICRDHAEMNYISSPR